MEANRQAEDIEVRANEAISETLHHIEEKEREEVNPLLETSNHPGEVIEIESAEVLPAPEIESNEVTVVNEEVVSNTKEEIVELKPENLNRQD